MVYKKKEFLIIYALSLVLMLILVVAFPGTRIIWWMYLVAIFAAIIPTLFIYQTITIFYWNNKGN